MIKNTYPIVLSRLRVSDPQWEPHQLTKKNYIVVMV